MADSWALVARENSSARNLSLIREPAVQREFGHHHVVIVLVPRDEVPMSVSMKPTCNTAT